MDIHSLPFAVKAALLSGENTWETRSVPRIGLPSLFMADGPHGLRKQTGSADHLGINASLPATCFPTAATVANSWSPELGERIGEALGAEANAQDVSVILGPGLNIKRSPLCGRNFEYFSEDPLLAGRMAAAYIRGIQSTGVAASPKHFAVNSQETRRMTNDSVVDQDTLASIYLTAFEIAVKEGSPWVLMSSYNLINGTYANESSFLLQDQLRDAWGFDGCVVTDWGGGNDPVAAINNGGGIEMPSPGFNSVQEILSRREEVDEEQLDRRVAELVTLSERITHRGPASIDHDDLAREAAEQSVVLLKNDGVLPLTEEPRIAVIGDFAFEPRYQGAGSSQVNPLKLTSPLEALEASDLTITCAARGFTRNGSRSEELAAEAVRAAETADIVLLYIGLDEAAESEGQERLSLELPEFQVRLIEKLSETGKPIVAVLSGGAPITMPWIEECAAVVHGYLGGQSGAEAVVKVLSGEVNPSGHLAESYPLELGDTPTAGWYPSKGAYSYYKEGPFVGYRYYQTVDREVLFPFGYGLSYTTFAYSNLHVDESGATVTVTNTGGVSGTDVVQMYIQGNPAIAAPAWELKGFARVSLEPGESGTVTIPFDEYSFRSAYRGSWHVFEGPRTIRVSQDVTDEGLAVTYHVHGEQPEFADIDVPNFAAGRAPMVSDDEFSRVLGRPLPTEEPGPLTANSPLGDIKDAKSATARLLYRLVFARSLKKMEQTGKPDLNILFLYNMPFRAIAKMSGGLASTEMVDHILDMVNGHIPRGLTKTVGAFFRNRRNQKKLRIQFDSEASRD